MNFDTPCPMMKIRSSRCAQACPASMPPTPPVTIGKYAAMPPPSPPLQTERRMMSPFMSRLLVMRCLGTSAADMMFSRHHGIANSPTNAGMMFWNATSCDTGERVSRMNPSSPASTNVASPASSVFHAS